MRQARRVKDARSLQLVVRGEKRPQPVQDVDALRLEPADLPDAGLDPLQAREYVEPREHGIARPEEPECSVGGTISKSTPGGAALTSLRFVSLCRWAMSATCIAHSVRAQQRKSLLNHIFSTSVQDLLRDRFVLASCFELVTHAVAGLEKCVNRRATVDLVAKLANEHVHGSVPVTLSPAPEFLE